MRETADRGTGASAIPRLDSGSAAEAIVHHLQRDGCCIVERLIDVATIRAVNEDLAPHVAATLPSHFEASGRRTRRTGALIAKSRASHAILAHPAVTAAARLLLQPCSRTIQFAVTQHISVDPGERDGALHRDECAWDLPPFAVPLEVELSTIWALDDFTAENGATRIAPGSHRGDAAVESFAAMTLPAEMPAGSVAIYTGKTVHRSGANRSDAPRRALHVTYCADWLRQKENQFLSTPPEIARDLDPDLRALAGYAMGAFMLGYTRNFEDPQVALYPERYMPLGG
ncbi:MAG: phytanoyl-CoA dioxygenase family protein [Gammaproteobacteria bacterium]